MSNNKNETTGTVTVVTAYYRVKSKHSPKQYHAWINNLLLHVGQNCKMVIFTSPDLVEYMNSVCKKNDLGASFTVISMEMKEFKLLKPEHLEGGVFVVPAKIVRSNNRMLFDMEFQVDVSEGGNETEYIW